jgi:hypothetical protein
MPILGSCSNWKRLIRVDLREFRGRELPAKTFHLCEALESVVGWEGIRKVGESCFRRSGVRECELDGVEEVGGWAFACSKLGEAGFMGNLLSVGKYAFNMTKLREVRTGGGLREVGASAFGSNYELEVADMSESPLETLAQEVFALCKKLSKFSWPRGFGSFKGCGQFSGTKVGPGFDVVATVWREIPAFVFLEAPLQYFKFPLLLEKVGAKAFMGSKLREIDLRWTKLKMIGEEAFADSNELRAVRLGAGVRVKASAFYSWSLQLVFFEAGESIELDGKTFQKAQREGEEKMENSSIVEFVLKGMKEEKGEEADVVAAIEDGLAPIIGFVRGEGVGNFGIATAPLRAHIG